MNEDIGAIKKQMGERLSRLQETIDWALERAGRTRDNLTLIGVSKTYSALYARAAVELGVVNLGENRVQEWRDKDQELALMSVHPTWHLVGSLQKNKVKFVVGRIDLIHAIDDIALLDTIEQRCVQQGVDTHVLLQVNVSGEASKHGFEPDELACAIDHAKTSCGHINLCGLMTMAPISAAIMPPHQVFLRTKKLFDRLSEAGVNRNKWTVLSMGMSQDFEAAIACGATHIRIGQALFGDRKVL